MAQITRNLIVPLIDTAKKWDGAETQAEGVKWVPIDLSTTFELEYNAQTDTVSYICYKNDSTKLTGYQPAMDQEIALESSNPMYQFIEGKIRQGLPVGSEAQFPVLIAEPTVGADSLEVNFGQVWKTALITVDTLNTVDGILTFHIDLSGDPVNVAVAGIGTANVTATPAPKAQP